MVTVVKSLNFLSRGMQLDWFMIISFVDFLQSSTVPRFLVLCNRFLDLADITVSDHTHAILSNM